MIGIWGHSNKEDGMHLGGAVGITDARILFEYLTRPFRILWREARLYIFGGVLGDYCISNHACGLLTEPETPTYVLRGLTFTSELLAQVERLLSPVR